MGKYYVEIEPSAKKEIITHKKSGDKSTIKKLEKILIELTESPFKGTGNPEALKHKLNGYWSRKINQKDRLIYKVEENIVTVFIVSAMGHYGDK
jgi:toxin YoeB